MKKAACEITVMAIILIIVRVACRLGMHNTCTAYISIPNGIDGEDIQIADEASGIVTHGTPKRRGDGYIHVPIRANRTGETWLTVSHDATELELLPIRVGRFGTIYDPGTDGFTGDSVALAAVTDFCPIWTRTTSSFWAASSARAAH